MTDKAALLALASPAIRAIPVRRTTRAKRGLVVGGLVTLAVAGSPVACLSNVIRTEDGQGGHGGDSANSAASGGRPDPGIVDQGEVAGTDLGATGGSPASTGGGGPNSTGGGGPNSTGGGGPNSTGGSGGQGSAGQGPGLGFLPRGSDLCPGQSYEVPLDGQGGVPPFTWAIDEGGGGTETLSAQSGTTVDLAGIAPNATSSVTVTITDSLGNTATEAVILNVDEVAPGLCPSIAPSELPTPCLGLEYNPGPVMMVNGTPATPGPVWTALSLPPGLAFDPTTHVISGTAEGPGDLTLEVIDGAGRSTQKTFPLVPREKCWLAFTSKPTGGTSQIHLVDPVLDGLAPLPEASSNNRDVVDFKFSPNGRFLVYRRLSENGESDLILLGAPNWQENVLDLGTSVLSYSWSTNSAKLAVAFGTSATTTLGGVDLSLANVTQGSSGGITGVTDLQPIPMLKPTSDPLTSDLVWFRSDPFDYVAFHADAQPGLSIGIDAGWYAQLGPLGFLAPVKSGARGTPELQLRPAYRGFFAIDPEPNRELWFVGNASPKDYRSYLNSEYASAVADPGGRYVARLEGDTLLVFSTPETLPATATSTNDVQETSNGGPGCGNLLAWDSSRERIVCDAAIAGSNGSGEIRFFDLDNSAPIVNSTASVPNVTTVKELTGYIFGSAIERSRAFSKSGNLFAFTTDNMAYIVNTQAAPYVASSVGPHLSPFPESPLDELSFSPDEKLLIWQRGPVFTYIDLQKNAPSNVWFGTNDPLPLPAGCIENFVAGPDTWCGSSPSPGTLAWSSDSRFLATSNAAGVITTYDFAPPPETAKILTIDRCKEGCSSQFAFQP